MIFFFKAIMNLCLPFLSYLKAHYCSEKKSLIYDNVVANNPNHQIKLRGLSQFISYLYKYPILFTKPAPGSAKYFTKARLFAQKLLRL